MKTLTQFLPYVTPYAMGCPANVARQAVLAAAIDFCERSNLVEATLDAANTVAGEAEIALDVPRQQTIAMVTRAWFKTQELQLVARAHISAVQAWNQEVPGATAATGEPRECYWIDGNTVGVHPAPATSESGVLTVRAALRPTRNATAVADALFDNWVETIAAGALARIYATPGQPYSDMSTALARRQEFMTGIQRARIESATGRVQGELRVQMRPFA